MDARALSGLKADLESFMEELTVDMPRSETRGWARAYVRGLLLDGERKSVEPMADRLAAIDRDGRDIEQALQQFVNQSPWPASAARDRLGAGWLLGAARLQGATSS
jgi:SRSO17 transposase